MTEAPSPRLEEHHPLCKYLRGKKMYTAADPTAVTAEELIEGSFQGYWCLHTFTDTGPDDGYVDYFRCAPGRSCYVAREASETAP